MKIPVYIAGKTIRVQKGVMLDWLYVDNIPLQRWTALLCNQYPGYIYQGLFADAACTIPLNRSTVIEKPLSVFPKLIKR